MITRSADLIGSASLIGRSQSLIRTTAARGVTPCRIDASSRNPGETPVPQHIETHEIRVFKAVYEHRGFKRAADKLFVTQSAVSQTIAGLERKLDTTLLERNPLKLTETGIRLLHYAEAVLGEEAQVWRDISNIKNGVLGSLLLATSSTVNALYGETLIMAFLEEAPSPGSRST